MKKNANFANINVLFGEEGTRKVALLQLKKKKKWHY